MHPLYDKKLQLDIWSKKRKQFGKEYHKVPIRYHDVLVSKENQYHRLLAELDKEEFKLKKGKQQMMRRENNEDMLPINELPSKF